MNVNKLLTELLARMPELEWQLSKLGAVFSPSTLPPGLFHQPYDAPVTDYIAEIKKDIARLSSQTNFQRTHYLALKINQKINVLVALCASYNQKATQDTSCVIDALLTRKSWLATMEQNLQTFSVQQDALIRRMEQRTSLSMDAQLNLQKELGELEKKLTLVREAYFRATGSEWNS